MRWMALTLAAMLTLTLVAGCGKPTGPPASVPAAQPADPLADPGQGGALAALEAYGQARRSLDFDRAYELLTPAAREAFTVDEFKVIYAAQRSFTYGSIAVDPPEAGFTKGYLEGLIISTDRTYRFARYPYTLRYEDGRWAVAQGTGLTPRLLKAFGGGKFEEHLKLADRWQAIDPQAWEPYLERFYAHKELNQPEAARAAWEKALELAPPEERPALYDTLSMLYLLREEGGPLKETAQKALDSVKELGKEHAERYDLIWRAGVVIDLAFAYDFMGDTTTALKHYEEALALDPRNKDVERFERTMSQR